jgi:hypothetical protein
VAGVWTQMEKDCYTAVRHADIETQDILKLRKREEMAITLETSLFDADADESKANNKDDAKEHDKDVSGWKSGCQLGPPLVACTDGHRMRGRPRPRWTT